MDESKYDRNIIDRHGLAIKMTILTIAIMTIAQARLFMPYNFTTVKIMIMYGNNNKMIKLMITLKLFLLVLNEFIIIL